MVFMKAAAAIRQLESSVGRTIIVLSEEKKKEKPKSSSVERDLSSNECGRIHENKIPDGPGECFKGHKKIPANLTQVIDLLLDIVLKYTAAKSPKDGTGYSTAMEVDKPTTKVKGKSKVDEAKKIESDSLSKQSAGFVKPS